MKAGTLLRIGLYLIAIWALFTAATAGAHQLFYFISGYENGVGFWFQQTAPALFAYFVFPVVFATSLFAASGTLVRRTLGGRAEELLPLPARCDGGALGILLQVLGAYLLAIYGASLVATVFELFALRIADTRLAHTKELSDLIANLVGFFAGGILTLRTQWVVARLRTHSAGPEGETESLGTPTTR